MTEFRGSTAEGLKEKAERRTIRLPRPLFQPYLKLKYKYLQEMLSNAALVLLSFTFWRVRRDPGHLKLSKSGRNMQSRGSLSTL